MRDWNKLYKKIGPLRYQSSTSDCVPTTIVNGLMVLLEDRLHPKLLQLIWTLAGDQDDHGGTGWVCCDTLAVLLSKWFDRAHQDKREKGPLPFESQIIEGDTVNLDPRGKLLRCLKNGGVACLVTGKNSDHYSLIIGIENENFLGFDCWWDTKKIYSPAANFDVYKGMVNIIWTHKELDIELRRSAWVHILSRR